VLKEELQNSIQMKINYEKSLAKLPRGSLVKKRIKGNKYYYIIFREKGKVKFVYKGRRVSQKLIDKYMQIKKLRAKYRNSLSKLKKQIKFIKGTLRGKEPV